MTKHPYQTCLRMPQTLKDDMTEISDQLSVNESDFMRRAIAEFLRNLKETPSAENRYLFT